MMIIYRSRSGINVRLNLCRPSRPRLTINLIDPTKLDYRSASSLFFCKNY